MNLMKIIIICQVVKLVVMNIQSKLNAIVSTHKIENVEVFYELQI
jgi:hypothetical protein